MKKKLNILIGLFSIITAIFMINMNVKAADALISGTSSTGDNLLMSEYVTNTDYRLSSSFPMTIQGFSTGIITQDGTNIYNKGFDNTGRAFCTRFWKDFKATSCRATWWSQDAEKNKRIAAAVGAMINKARSLSGGSAAQIDTDVYFYGEMAINYFIYNYSGKKDYNNVTKLRNWSNISSRQTFKSIYSAGTTAYDNYGKIVASFSNMKINYDPSTKTVTATAVLTCYDAKGKKVACSARCVNTGYIEATDVNGQTLNSGSTKLNSTCPRATDGMYYNYTASHKFTTDTEIKQIKASFETKNTISYPIAQEYYCGSESYQNLTPNMLKTLSESKDVKIEKTTEIANQCNIKLIKTDGTNNLSGATFELYDGNTKVDSGTTGTDGTVTFTGLISGKTYQYKEVKAPSGYVLDGTPRNVTCGDTTVTNTKTTGSLRIRKVDAEGNAVAGAKLRVYYITASDDSNTNNAENGYSESQNGNDYNSNDGRNYEYHYINFDGNDYFITTNTDKVITGLTVGETYYVEEVALPEGTDYAIKVGSDEVTIVAGDNNVATLENIHSNFKISKQDITSKKELPGAEIVITDIYGTEIEKWTSTEVPHEIKGLADGEYILTEITAPKGYKKAESIRFTIENGKLKDDDDNTLVMYDDTSIFNIPDTLSARNILIILSGMAIVAAGIGIFLYGVKRKDQI